MDFAHTDLQTKDGVSFGVRRMCSVAIRITTKTDGNKTTIFVEGRLSAVEAPDLRKECQSADALLRLDLSGLKSVDPTGITLLRSLSATGAELCGVSAFISKLLEGSSK
jgi:anti-anti-sigma regulatory factor